MSCFGGSGPPRRPRQCSNPLLSVCSALPENDSDSESESPSRRVGYSGPATRTLPDGPETGYPSVEACRPRSCSNALIAVCSTLPQNDSDSETEDAATDWTPSNVTQDESQDNDASEGARTSAGELSGSDELELGLVSGNDSEREDKGSRAPPPAIIPISYSHSVAFSLTPASARAAPGVPLSQTHSPPRGSVPRARAHVGNVISALPQWESLRAELAGVPRTQAQTMLTQPQSTLTQTQTMLTQSQSTLTQAQTLLTHTRPGLPSFTQPQSPTSNTSRPLAQSGPSPVGIEQPPTCPLLPDSHSSHPQSPSHHHRTHSSHSQPRSPHPHIPPLFPNIFSPHSVSFPLSPTQSPNETSPSLLPCSSSTHSLPLQKGSILRPGSTRVDPGPTPAMPRSLTQPETLSPASSTGPLAAAS